MIKVLRLIGTGCFLASFILMVCEVYGATLFMDVLAGIVILAIAAYMDGHKEICKDDTTPISTGATQGS